MASSVSGSGTSNDAIVLSITAPDAGDTSSATRQRTAIETLLDNDARLLARLVGSAIVAAINSESGTGLTRGSIADDAVNAEKLSAASGSQGQLLQLRVNNGLGWTDPITIATGNGLSGGGNEGTVTITISAGGIGTTELADDAVTSAKLGAGSVDSTAIGADAVTASKIADAAVDVAQLNAGTASDGKVLTATSATGMAWEDATGGGGDITDVVGGIGITASESSGTVTVRITADGVTNALIADDAVQAENIADDAVDATKLDTTNTGSNGQILQKTGNRMVWVAKPTGQVSSVNGGTGITVNASTGAVTVSISNNGIGSAQIANNAVGSSELQANSVGSSEIATNAVGASEIASNAVGISELNAGGASSGRVLTATSGSAMAWQDAGSGQDVSWSATIASRSGTSSASVEYEKAYRIGDIVFYSGQIDVQALSSSTVTINFSVPYGNPSGRFHGVSEMHQASGLGSGDSVNSDIYTTGSTTNFVFQIYSGHAAGRVFGHFSGWYAV